MTTRTEHERASRLVRSDWIEGLAPEDRAWLGAHLAQCEACRGVAAGVERVVASLRRFTAGERPALVAGVRAALRERARLQTEARGRRLMLAVSCGLAALWWVVLHPVVWALAAGAGRALGLGPVASWAGLFCAWFLPATLAAAWLAARRALAEPGGRAAAFQ